MEHNIVQNIKAVNGDKVIFRRWHLNFIPALGQVKGEYEEIVHVMVGEIDLGRELDKTLVKLQGDNGLSAREAYQDIWIILIDKAES